MKLTEVTSYRSRTATILNEGYQDLTESQVIYLNRWEKELWPLVEQYIQEASQNLTPDQIQDIFKGAESVADASGGNKNLLGKAGSAVGAAAKLPVDVAKKVDAKINELGQLAKNAGPVRPKTLVKVSLSIGDHSTAVAFMATITSNVVKILAKKPATTT